MLSSRSADTLLMLTLIVALTVMWVACSMHCAALSWAGSAPGLRINSVRPCFRACFEYAYRADPARASEAYRDLTTLRQFAKSGACPMLFDVLWTPLFLFVLFLVHPLLGLIGTASAIALSGLAFAGDFVTEGPLARSVAALTHRLMDGSAWPSGTST